MVNWRVRGIGLAALPLALAACAGAVTATRVFNPRYDLVYSAAEVRAAGGFMPVQVFGTPPDGASPEEVAAQMDLSGRFRNKPAQLVPASEQGRRIVLAFHLAMGEQLCKGSGAVAGAGTEQLVASAAFCIGDRMLTTAQLKSGETRGPRDAAFRPAILQLYSELLPNQNPELRPDGPLWMFH